MVGKYLLAVLWTDGIKRHTTQPDSSKMQGRRYVLPASALCPSVPGRQTSTPIAPSAKTCTMRTPADEEATIVGDMDTRSLARRSLASVHELVDIRITAAERPSDAMLDEGYLRQLSGHAHHHEAKSDKKTLEQSGSEDTNADETIYVNGYAAFESSMLICVFAGRVRGRRSTRPHELLVWPQVVHHSRSFHVLYHHR